MRTVNAPTGMWCLDAAGFTSTTAVLNAARRTDIGAFSFYIGNKFGVSKTQFQIAFDHGKLVSPNREGDSHEAYSWASGPVREIDQTRSILDSFGIDWRKVPTIDSAVDWNPLSSELSRCDDWWKAYVDHALAVGFWGGYYGATAYGKRLVAFDWWPDNFPTWTWGGSGEIPNTNMKQFAGYPSGHNYSSIGVTVDESIVRTGLVMASSFDSPLDPEEEDMLDANDHAYLDAKFNDTNAAVAAVWSALTADPGTGIPMNWAAQLTYDWTQKHAPTADQIAAAVVAALPPGTTNLTKADVQAACEAALDGTLWATLRQAQSNPQ